jgi:hypothetical protein
MGNVGLNAAMREAGQMADASTHGASADPEFQPRWKHLRYHVAAATGRAFAGAGLPFMIPSVDFSGEGGDVGAACYCRAAQEAI